MVVFGILLAKLAQWSWPTMLVFTLVFSINIIPSASTTFFSWYLSTDKRYISRVCIFYRLNVDVKHLIYIYRHDCIYMVLTLQSTLCQTGSKIFYRFIYNNKNWRHEKLPKKEAKKKKNRKILCVHVGVCYPKKAIYIEIYMQCIPIVYITLNVYIKAYRYR